MTDTAVRLLVVEDNAADARLLREQLRDVPGRLDWREVGRLDDAIVQLQSDPPDVTLLDLGLPDSAGLATLDAVQGAAPAVPIIVLTGLNDEEIALRAVRTGAQDYLIKGEVGVAGLIRTIRYAVARHRSEQQLRREKAFTEAILDSMPGAICLLDDSGRLVRWNHRFEEFTGYSAAEIAARSAIDYYSGPDRNTVIDAMRRVLADGRAEIEVNMTTRSGASVPLFISGTRLQLDGRWYLTAVGLDISARKRAEDDLRRSEQRLRAILENASEAIALIDASGTIVFQTPAIERITGFAAEEMVGHHLADRIHPDDRPRALEAFRHAMNNPGVDVDVEARHRTRDGSWRLLQAIGRRFPTPVDRAIGVVVSRDVTERRALEDQLRQAQKMDAVGRLAGGVAHDFNNLLTAILGFTELLLVSLPPDAPSRADAAEIRNAAERAAGLTRQLLAVSRAQILQPQLLDLNATIEGMAKLLRRVIREDIEFETDLDRASGRVFADRGQIEQVLMNLVVNARDAIPGRGRITVTTSTVVRLEPFGVGDTELPAGTYVRLTVRDTGCGIVPEAMDHLFEPFFTTKDPGKGTGLGLATVYGIVKQARGAIAVETAPGEGSAFSAYFPVSPPTR